MEHGIEQLLDAEEGILPRPSDAGLGTVVDYHEGALKHISSLEQIVPSSLEGLKVVVDVTNGAISDFISNLFVDMNVDFIPIGDQPGGLNTNLNRGSAHPGSFQKAAVENNADLEVVFDSDGDRCTAVDNKGNIVDGDKIIYICGRYMDKKGSPEKNTVVTAVMNNLGMYKALEMHNLKDVETKVGDQYVVEEMLKDGHNPGDKQSGHIIFLGHSTAGDGMLTVLQLLSVVKDFGKTLAGLVNDVTTYP